MPFRTATRSTSAGPRCEIVEIPGHTLGAIAFITEGNLFSGDTLFIAGCGRVFEGTMEMMSRSLAKLRSLPADTKVWCGHEYTINNLRFAKTIEPSNPNIDRALAEAIATREAKRFTVPGRLDRELATNPFLRFDAPDVAAGRDPISCVHRHSRSEGPVLAMTAVTRAPSQLDPGRQRHP